MHTHRFHWFWNISISKEIIITNSTTKIIVIIIIIIITTLEAIRQTSSSIQRKSYYLAGSPVFILLSSLNSMTFFIGLFHFSMSLSLAVILKQLLNSLVFRYFFSYMSVQETKGTVSTKMGAIFSCSCFDICGN